MNKLSETEFQDEVKRFNRILDYAQKWLAIPHVDEERTVGNTIRGKGYDVVYALYCSSRYRENEAIEFWLMLSRFGWFGYIDEKPLHILPAQMFYLFMTTCDNAIKLAMDDDDAAAPASENNNNNKS